MTSETKRFKSSADKDKVDYQLSGLFNIIANNLQTATAVLSTDQISRSIKELDIVSKKAKSITQEILTNQDKDVLSERISSLKEKMLVIINSLSEELNKLDPNEAKNKKAIEDIVLARRLLRESQRGLSTL